MPPTTTSTSSLARARTLLFVPGNRPERFEKALRSGADAIVLDLEDSVPLSAKQSAREAIRDSWSALQTGAPPLRFAVAMATRLHRLGPALDGVTVAIDDDDRLREDTRRAVRFGFGGKLCIHPRQVAVVHDALSPSAGEIDWARRVIAADATSGGGAVQVDGRMVDLPVVLQARRTLARARGSQAS